MINKIPPDFLYKGLGGNLRRRGFNSRPLRQSPWPKGTLGSGSLTVEHRNMSSSSHCLLRRETMVGGHGSYARPSPIQFEDKHYGYVP